MSEPWEIGCLCSVSVDGGHEDSMTEIYADSGVVGYVYDPENAMIVSIAPRLVETVKRLLSESESGAIGTAMQELRELILELPASEPLGEIVRMVTPKEDDQSNAAKVGDKFVAIETIDVYDDVAWEPGTVVEVIRVYEFNGGYDLEDEGGNNGHFAPCDVFGENRWFDRYNEDESEPLGEIVRMVTPKDAE